MAKTSIYFKEAISILGIEDYEERIFNSHSSGELFHLDQYATIAEIIKGDATWFRSWFEGVVEYANKNHRRPSAIYQHIYRVLCEDIESQRNEKQG